MSFATHIRPLACSLQPLNFSEKFRRMISQDQRTHFYLPKISPSFLVTVTTAAITALFTGSNLAVTLIFSSSKLLLIKTFINIGDCSKYSPQNYMMDTSCLICFIINYYSFCSTTTYQSKVNLNILRKIH